MEVLGTQDLRLDHRVAVGAVPVVGAVPAQPDRGASLRAGGAVAKVEQRRRQRREDGRSRRCRRVPNRGGDGAPQPHLGGRKHRDRVECRPKKLQEAPLLGWLLELAGHPVEAGVDLARTQVPLDFRGYAAADAQARWTALICSGVALPGRSGRNRAAMMVRRSLASMSSKDGSVLVVYQGWRARRSVTSSGWWPCRAYQMTTRLMVSMPNGTVRSTACSR